MVSNNYSSYYFQSSSSRESRIVPYVEPLFVPTTWKRAFPYAEYTTQNEMGSYKVSVNVLKSEEGFIIEHVTSGNLLMRVQIIRENILNSSNLRLISEYGLLLNKYADWYKKDSKFHIKTIDSDVEKSRILIEQCVFRAKQARIDGEQRTRDFEKIMAESEELLRNLERRDRERAEERANDPVLIFGGIVVNTAIATKKITQSALIATRETVVKTATVAKESISKLVFFCSYALVRFTSSQGVGRNCKMQRYVPRQTIPSKFQSIFERQRHAIFRQTSKNTSYSNFYF